MNGRALLAILAVLGVWLAAPAEGGYVTGSGPTRQAHLFDAGNSLEAVVAVPESFSGFTGYTYEFTLRGSAGTVGVEYRAVVVVSPGGDTEARWNGSGEGPSGNATAVINVTIGPDALQFTLPNTPFAVELRSSNGSLLDSTLYSADLRYREPPADGGLLQLAIASACFWGAVLLYAVNLQMAQRKLRAKAQALERPLSAAKEIRDHDDKR